MIELPSGFLRIIDPAYSNGLWANEKLMDADDIEFEAPTPPVTGVIGGAGSYAAVGARMVAGQEHSNTVGWIVDCGSDFPGTIKETILSWNTHCIFREDHSRLTTRGWNGYGPDEKRDFRYLTPKLRLDEESLTNSLLLSKTFHIICSSLRCCELVDGILKRRSEVLKETNIDSSQLRARPIFVWEPVPDRCFPEELENFYKAIRYVDVVSPNENELARFFGGTVWTAANPQDQRIAAKITQFGIGPKGDGMLVIRAGKDGCYAFSRNGTLKLPAYKFVDVVDPTGAGNTFLGALAQGLVSSGRAPFNVIQGICGSSVWWPGIKCNWGNDEETPTALICATIAASFAIEQIGLPKISFSNEGFECWNGSRYTERIRLYMTQLRDLYDTFSKGNK
ncbi:hypothetical protein LOZ12_001206 [Ophidiomyces ophidiicola]|uniref:Uncharacterized protein n=1 Tax=Ophidiomyces ophidiicola TaxID=1387563 RepID=A0ACB8V2T3_9EURO|nr:hypothetical protein LOZ64_001558 [Ophidiomyces ophidiicola]KAI1950220.1 hypothetical protein LOZ62_001966 [Ophidiomyces ophidiicola]KAI1972960.1 hypothetical protein LOZ56_002155 [Ophidiomyces ophidiicola]KAI2005256.1 hypothetical protein LOZ49_005492 [Ophidiomyces ophidiicola]KAI2008561.1 hypothetical protein LOZ50_002028 [Ophidiomyces ophidiicola]